MLYLVANLHHMLENVTPTLGSVNQSLSPAWHQKGKRKPTRRRVWSVFSFTFGSRPLMWVNLPAILWEYINNSIGTYLLVNILTHTFTYR